MEKKSVSSRRRAVYMRLKDSNCWPGLAKPDFLQVLEEIAVSAAKRGSIEGSLAAILIYHQLAEEMIRVLLEDSVFFVEASVWPGVIDSKLERKRKKMFGGLIEDLKWTVRFWERDSIIKAAKDLNEVRNKVVHRLTEQDAKDRVLRQAAKAQKHYRELFESFEVAHDWFLQSFHDIGKDLEWSDDSYDEWFTD